MSLTLYCDTAVSQTAGLASTSLGGMRIVWWPEYTELRHQRAKPRPQYGSRHSATCLDGYSSHWSFMALHSAVVEACDILMPASMPVVETEKSRKASISAVGARYTPGSFDLRTSSVSSVAGQDYREIKKKLFKGKL